MKKILHFEVRPISMITHENTQRVDLICETIAALHATLRVFADEKLLCETDVALNSGTCVTTLYLTPPESDTETVWEFSCEEEILRLPLLWKKPREWTFYVMLSSHTDIGLHNSQYYQRYHSERFLDEAAALCGKTDDRPENDRYRYTMEGSWFFENYPHDRGNEAAEKMLDTYVRTGKIGCFGGIAGNHTHAYGFEEMCRSAYTRTRLEKRWGIHSESLCMIDNNGLSWGMVQPYADAGYKNLLFAPNQWNPLPSTVWKCDQSVPSYTWNPNAGGGGARVDVRYDSALPMLFFWRSADDNKELLVWASTQYGHGAMEFGFCSNSKLTPDTLGLMTERFANRLPKMEARMPYDIWLLASYSDDQAPSLDQTNLFAAWNKRWKYPVIRTLGDPDVPFNEVRRKFGNQIPVLKGEITGGWYQHPAAAAELLAAKLNTDRRLANAETFASLAAAFADKPYPKEGFDRAWDGLFWNDEHSYGTSGYQGRRVYETWMQHRDWIDKAADFAASETDAALKALAAKIPAENGGAVAFNPTANTRTERVFLDGREAVVTVPPCGYRAIPADALVYEAEETMPYDTPPTVENSHYRLRFGEDGAIASIYDKKLEKELLGSPANRMIFTEDNHKTFLSPKKATFSVTKKSGRITVTAKTKEPVSGASIEQAVTLDELHRRIDIDNRLSHVKSMFNTHRYYRYLYYAFPFAVENARRVCQLNGCEAVYADTLTGHGTDTYMASHEWCAAENESFGCALFEMDTQLVEFDHIHPDKTDCGAAGKGSAIFSYVANDWLQMHLTGGSHLHYRLRYAITSWEGGRKTAGIAEMAENWCNPLAVVLAADGEKTLTDAKTFVETAKGQRLVCLKAAEDGNGLIARLYGDMDKAAVCFNGIEGMPQTINELPSEKPQGRGFTTFRLGTAALPIKAAAPDLIDEQTPAPIGSVYTGLITKPMAFRGENDGHLYLIWGQNMEKNLSHYELYRSETAGFTPCADTFLAKVEPGEYRVGLYVDEGLAVHKPYYYRVRAVNSLGKAGAFSDEFCGITKEPTQY